MSRSRLVGIGLILMTCPAVLSVLLLVGCFDGTGRGPVFPAPRLPDPRGVIEESPVGPAIAERPQPQSRILEVPYRCGDLYELKMIALLSRRIYALQQRIEALEANPIPDVP